MVLRCLVKTLSGTAAETLAVDSVKAVRVGAKIMADNGDTVYVGGADVDTGTGFLLPTTPGDAISLGDITTEAGGLIDLTKIYVKGANGDKIRILYFKNEPMV